MIGYITGISIWERGFKGTSTLPDNICDLTKYQQDPEELPIDIKIRFRQLEIDSSHVFFPKASDVKVLRPDSIASIILVQELLSELEIKESDRQNIMLFVANSNFIDNSVLNLDEMAEVIKKIQNAGSNIEKNQILSAAVSPLLPLKTLTNGSESFLAQYTQILGENATYGSTNVSTVQGLSDACMFFNLSVSNQAIIGGTSLANLFSFLNNHLLIENLKDYSESSAASFIMFESEEALFRNQHKVLLEVVEISYNFPTSSTNVDWVFYGGSFSEIDFQKLTEKISKLNVTHSFSWFPFTGNLGCAEFGFLTAAANKWMKSGEIGVIYLEDPYQMMVSIKVKKT